MLLDDQRALVQEFIVPLDVPESVTAPEEGEVPVNLVDQRCPKRLVLVCKSCQSHDPVVQIGALIVVAHPLVVVLNNLLERVHDVGEETDSTQHEEYSDNLLVC